MSLFHHLMVLLLVGSACLALLVDGQKKNKPPTWKKPQSWPFNRGMTITKFSGSDVILNCSAYGYPKPKTTWFKDGDVFNERLRPKTKARDSYLSLKDVQISDTGNYTCLVRNSVGSINFTVRLNIVDLEMSLLLLVDKAKNVTVMEGERVVLRCMALNDPEANIQWEKWTDSIDDVTRHNSDLFSCNGPEIVFEKVQIKDAGKYTCTIEYSTTYSIEIKSDDVWLTVNKASNVSKGKMNGIRGPGLSNTTNVDDFSGGSGEGENVDDGIHVPRLPSNPPIWNFNEGYDDYYDYFDFYGIPDKDQLPLNNKSFRNLPEGKTTQRDEEENTKTKTIYIIVGIVAGVVLFVGGSIMLVLYRNRLRIFTVTK